MMKNIKQYQNGAIAEIDKNRQKNYDPIAETYKEFTDRLEKGKTQQEYFQEKADSKKAELENKEAEYSAQMGNLEGLTAKLDSKEFSTEELEKKEEFLKQYQELKNLNDQIEKIEQDLNDPDIDDDKKNELTTKLEQLKEKRKEAVEKFAQEATNKDGKKYEREADESDKDYINGLDEVEIKEAVKVALDEFKQKLAAIPDNEATITMLDRDFKGSSINMKNMPITSNDDIKALKKELKKQKKLWEAKKVKDGFDKAELRSEMNKYQDKADSYTTINKASANTVTKSSNEAPLPVPEEKISWKHPIKKLQRWWQRRKVDKEVQQEQVDDNFDITETKKEALKYLESNKKELNKVDINKKKSQKYRDSIRYNVSLTETEINDFWDKQQNQTQKEDTEKGESR